MQISQWSSLVRKEDGMSQKFVKLHSINVPTGDPYMPDVEKAKQLRQDLISKIDMNDHEHDDVDFYIHDTKGVLIIILSLCRNFFAKRQSGSPFYHKGLKCNSA